MKVSIVIPVFNKESTVHESLMSAVSQNHRDSEIIVVDDGSVDNSLEVIKDVIESHSNVKLIRQSNQGLSGARNAGIDAAEGDYVLFHDADDILEPDAIDSLVLPAKEYGSDIVGGVFNRVVDGSSSRVNVFFRDDVNIDFKRNPELASRYATNFSSCNKIFKKDFLSENNLYFTPGLYMQDIEFWLKCMFVATKITQIKKVVSNYIFEASSSSQSKTESRFESLFSLFDNLDDFYSKHGLQSFGYVKNKAFLQGAAVFFIKWKLKEWFFEGGISDLYRLKKMLRRIPENHFVSFCRQNPMSPAPRLSSLVRDGDFDGAFKFSNHAAVVMDKLREEGKSLLISSGLSNFLADFRYGLGYKIVIFASGNLHNIGGVQRSYVFLVDYLCRMGFQVTLVGWGSGDLNDGLAYPLNDKANVVLINNAMSEKVRGAKEDLLIKEDPDLVLIVNSARYSVFLASLCLELNIPYVQSIRGSSEYCLRYLWPDMNFMESVFRCSIANHVLMDSYKNIFSSEVKSKTKSIPSQIANSEDMASPDSPNSNGRSVVLYSGRLSFEKRVDLLIHAFSRVHNQCSDWDLWVWGGGPLLEELKTLAEELGVSEKVVFGNAKNSEEMYEIYSKVNLKVLPSEQEGCPMSLREAMMNKLPVIAFEECSGANEIIEHKVNGLLVSSENDRSFNLAAAMEELMVDPGLRKHFGDNARMKAKIYNPELINEQWGALISYSLGESKKKSRSSCHDCWRGMLSQFYKERRFQRFTYFKLNENLYSAHRDEYLLVYGHNLFDHQYYLEKYIDVKISGEDPLLHYLVYGWRQGFNPSPVFDNNAYMDEYKVNICPLVHYYRAGRFQGIVPVGRDDEYLKKWPGRVDIDKVLDPSFDAKLEKQIFKRMH